MSLQYEIKYHFGDNGYIMQLIFDNIKNSYILGYNIEHHSNGLDFPLSHVMENILLQPQYKHMFVCLDVPLVGKTDNIKTHNFIFIDFLQYDNEIKSYINNTTNGENNNT